MTIEEFQPPSHSIRRFRRSMTRSGDQQKLERFVGADQPVDDLQRTGRIDILVQFSDDQQQ